MTSLMPAVPPGTATTAAWLKNAEKGSSGMKILQVCIFFFHPLENITQYFYTRCYIFFLSDFFPK